MKSISYASAIGNVMYAPNCTQPTLALITWMLGKYQKNPGIEQWKALKKALR
jgi:ABC-type thiamine transport system substrate-binding protein